MSGVGEQARRPDPADAGSEPAGFVNARLRRVVAMRLVLGQAATLERVTVEYRFPCKAGILPLFPLHRRHSALATAQRRFEAAKRSSCVPAQACKAAQPPQ